jgi:Flp pilus assembly protein CpaB
VLYLRSYRSSVNSGKEPERVLVATKVIPRGTSSKLIAEKRLYQVTTVQKDQLQELAITDPAAIKGRVAAADIFPGQQLTQDAFTTEGATSIPYSITGRQRAIAVPVDSAHGLVGQVNAGDFVDVYVGLSGAASGGNNVLTLLARRILVLVPPTTEVSNAILRVTMNQAPRFAYASDNARLWLVLRPQVGAAVTPPALVSLPSLVAGSR